MLEQICSNDSRDRSSDRRPVRSAGTFRTNSRCLTVNRCWCWTTSRCRLSPMKSWHCLGPSGCGKSTILRILAGLIQTDAGEVLYHDQPLLGSQSWRGDRVSELRPLSVADRRTEHSVVLTAAQVPPDEVETRADRVIRLVGLAGFEQAYPRELSGGMKQRVGMARALAVDPGNSVHGRTVQPRRRPDRGKLAGRSRRYLVGPRSGIRPRS